MLISDAAGIFEAPADTQALKTWQLPKQAVSGLLSSQGCLDKLAEKRAEMLQKRKQEEEEFGSHNSDQGSSCLLLGKHGVFFLIAKRVY